jgi:peptide chain release factor 2
MLINNYKKIIQTGNLILLLQSKEGGLDAKNFCFLLYQMYTKWFIKKQIKFKIISINKENEEILSSVTIKIFNTTEQQEKWLKLENGLCKLVRKSPFDFQHKRHTSFCEVQFFNEEQLELNIYKKDCKIDTYRASGKGGQNVNKVETAVRVTHIPSGIVVTCQEESNQYENKQRALIELEKRLILNKHNKEKENFSIEINKVLQNKNRSLKIKTYNFQSDYIIDHRTNLKINNLNNVFFKKDLIKKFFIQNAVEIEFINQLGNKFKNTV